MLTTAHLRTLRGSCVCATLLPPHPCATDDPASKQQWLHALGWWCQDSERLAAIDAMYAAYCQSMRDRSLLEYPEHVPQLEGGGEPAGGAAGEAAQVAGGGGQPAGARRGWKGWGNRVQTMRRKMQRGRSGAGDFPGVDGELAAGGSVPPSPDKRGSLALRASPAKPSLLDAAATSAEMSSLDSIIEARWMQSRKIQASMRSPQGGLLGAHPLAGNPPGDAPAADQLCSSVHDCRCHQPSPKRSRARGMAP